MVQSLLPHSLPPPLFARTLNHSLTLSLPIFFSLPLSHSSFCVTPSLTLTPHFLSFSGSLAPHSSLTHLPCLGLIMLSSDISRNRIMELPPAYCALPDLEDLDCAHNAIAELPDLSAMTSLRTLNLWSDAHQHRSDRFVFFLIDVYSFSYAHMYA